MIILDKVKKTIKISIDLLEETDLHKNINPHYEAFKIAIYYGIFGVIWIAISSEIIHMIFNDMTTMKKFELYKGWLYVIITSVLLYTFIRRRLFLFKIAVAKNEQAHEEISSAYKTLKEAEQQLDYKTYYSDLTQLPNRVWFEEKANKMLQEKSFKNGKVALMHLNMDNFKYVNNTLGYNYGNKLLRWISNILKHHIKEPNIVAHASGDEFLILFYDISNTEDIISKIEHIQSLLNRSWYLEKQDIFISASIGVAVYPEHGHDILTLLKSAETAMYYEKEKEKGGYSFYSEIVAKKALEFNWMINELKKAIKNEEFIVYYQPLIDLQSGSINGVEVLIRWNHPIKGWISPADFIPVAEVSGLIIDIGKWVFERSCEQKKIWNDKGLSDIKVSINLSGKELIRENIFSDIKETIDKYDLEYSSIQIEITETSIIKDLDKSRAILKQLRSLGIKIALDDFGTGYSSLNYLETLPIDALKIDKSFVDRIKDADQDEKIINVIIQLAHILNLEVVAEGVETKEQMIFLNKYHCNLAQGYLFSKPLPAKDIEILLETSKKYIIKH